jgi:aerobic C4-dicarboxylate transport protein
LAAILAIVLDISIVALAILVGIDKFMSECRALTNLIGNGVATVVISLMEGELNADQLCQTMAEPIIAGDTAIMSKASTQKWGAAQSASGSARA